MHAKDATGDRSGLANHAVGYARFNILHSLFLYLYFSCMSTFTVIQLKYYIYCQWNLNKGCYLLIWSIKTTAPNCILSSKNIDLWKFCKNTLVCFWYYTPHLCSFGSRLVVPTVSVVFSLPVKYHPQWILIYSHVFKWILSTI